MLKNSGISSISWKCRLADSQLKFSLGPSKWVVELQSQGWECLIVLECGWCGWQEVVTSLLLYKLTRLAHRCQCWPLVPDWDIICLCLWPQPLLGQGPVWELHCQAQEAAAPALSCLTPPGSLGYSMKGERPKQRDWLNCSWPEKVWRCFLTSLEELYLGYLQKQGQPALWAVSVS